MIFTTYNQHVRPLSSGPFVWFSLPKLTRAWEPTLLWNHYSPVRNGRPGSLSDLLDNGGLLHGGESALLHDGVVDVPLDGCQVRFAIHHKIGVVLAGKHVLKRCW